MKKIMNKKTRTPEIFVIRDEFIEFLPKKYPEKFVEKINKIIAIIAKKRCTFICDFINKIPTQNLIKIEGIINDMKFNIIKIK